MASDAQDVLYEIFAALAGGGESIGAGGLVGSGRSIGSGGSIGGGGSIGSGGLLLTAGGAALGAATGSVVSIAAAAAGAGSQSTQSQSSGGNTAETIAMDVLKSAFGLVPLVGALFGLFGGGGDPAPPPLTKYALPARQELQAAETASGFANVDYDQTGMPRVVERGATGGVPQVQVNVQAMDARSFLDRSSDIAAAVREAMLNLNSINDVVNDL